MILSVVIPAKNKFELLKIPTRAKEDMPKKEGIFLLLMQPS